MTRAQVSVAMFVAGWVQGFAIAMLGVLFDWWGA